MLSWLCSSPWNHWTPPLPDSFVPLSYYVWIVTTTKPNIYFLFAGFTLQLSVNFLFPEVSSLKETLHNVQNRADKGPGWALAKKNSCNSKFKKQIHPQCKVWCWTEAKMYILISFVSAGSYSCPPPPGCRQEARVPHSSSGSGSWMENVRPALGSSLPPWETEGSPQLTSIIHCFPSFGTVMGRIT